MVKVEIFSAAACHALAAKSLFDHFSLPLSPISLVLNHLRLFAEVIAAAKSE